MTCKQCNSKEELERHIWMEGIDILICNKCGRRYWFDRKKGKIMTNEEINKLGKEFNE